MKVDEKKLLDKIISLANPMALSSNEDLELVRKNSTAIISLCEVMIGAGDYVVSPAPNKLKPKDLYHQSFAGDVDFNLAKLEQVIER